MSSEWSSLPRVWSRVPRGGPWWPRERLGLRRSVRGMFLSVRDRGGCRKIQRGGAEGRRRKRERKRVKNLSEGRGKCINGPVAAGLTGLHGHGWANGYYTATCAKKKKMGYVTLSCGEVCWRAEVFALCFSEGILGA